LKNALRLCYTCWEAQFVLMAMKTMFGRSRPTFMWDPERATHRLWTRVISAFAWLASCVFLLGCEASAQTQMTDVLTYHNDNARTGQTLREEILTPANVNSNQFGKLWVLPTDGQVMAEPLYAAGVSIPGQGERNVLYVATANDTLYAFDADSTNVFWRVSMLEPGEAAYFNAGCRHTGLTNIGITATPVIDRTLGPNGTIFVQAMSCYVETNGTTNYFQRMHALDLSSGIDRVAPMEITASYPGSGENSSGGYVVFDPRWYLERACLLLLNGVIYTTWSAHCDQEPSTSWVMGFDEYSLAQTSVLNLTPNGQLGSMWNSDAGPAADPNGNIYVTLGNGTFDSTLDANGFPSAGDFANSFLKLTTAKNILAVADYFTMSNVQAEIETDLDLSSGSPLVLPVMTDAQGNPRQLVITAGKDQNIYLADAANMGKFNPTNNNSLYQEITDIFTSTNNAPPLHTGQNGGIWSLAAYFNGTVYFGPVHGPITAFPLQNARLASSSSQSPNIFGYPGATPSISANGASNGIVWAYESPEAEATNVSLSLTNAATLHAYVATNLAIELYNSNQATNNRDYFGDANHFITPMIASARVYVGTTTGVGVFGLLDPTVLTPLQQWRNDLFGNPSNVGAGANAACPAGDGVPNLTKYALGLDPFTPVSADELASAGILQLLGQNYLTLNVSRAADPPDVSYLAEVSSDLQTWNSGLSNTTTISNTATQLIIRDNAQLGSGSNQFMRLLFLPVSNP
jgi:hypothetical protein